MTMPEFRSRTTEPAGTGQHHGGHRGHGWMMIACCIPMVAIAVILVATGVAGPGFLFVALGCTAMMALMMSGMHGGGSRDSTTDPANEPAKRF